MERGCCEVICGAPTTSQNYGIDRTELSSITYNLPVSLFPQLEMTDICLKG